MPKELMIITRLGRPTLLPPPLSRQNVPPCLGVEMKWRRGSVVVGGGDGTRGMIEAMVLVAKKPDPTNADPCKTHLGALVVGLDVG